VASDARCALRVEDLYPAAESGLASSFPITRDPDLFAGAEGEALSIHWQQPLMLRVYELA
jgi:hypothetical protein